MKLDPNRKFWNPEIEEMPSDQLRELQFEKLKKQVKYIYENSIFYKDHFDQAGVKPEDIQTWDDFYRFPTMTKDDQREAQEESIKRFGHPFGMLMCTPIEKIVRISSTSGTTGIPTLYTLTKHDVNTVRECHARKGWLTGLRPGDIVLHAMALSMFTGGIPGVDGVQEYGACIVPVGIEGGVARVLQYIDLCKPTVLLTTPSFAEYIIEKCPEILGKPASELGIKKLSVGGKPGGGISAVRKRLEEGFNADQVYDGIGGSHNFHGYTCTASMEEYKGMHLVSEDYCVLEILDPETKESLEITDGAIGEMCYTYIDWEGSPLFGYRLGDMLQLFTEPCECGDHRLRFKIIGRADDMLIVKGVNVYPAALKSIITEFMPRTTGQLRILLEAPGPQVTPPLKVQVEYGQDVAKEDLPALESEIRDKMRSILRVTPQIEFVPPNTF